ncbi:MAG: glutaredoxin 3 [Alphaproteobacteria bacterium]|nr:glutaredoxin 3 [Alphaproteobacteria bacterium]
MNKVVIYTAVPCGYCSAAKRFFAARNIPFQEIDLTGDHEARARLSERTRQRTVPQIFIGDAHVGGYSDLMDLHRTVGVDSLLNEIPGT